MNSNPAMERKEFTQRRKGAKGSDFVKIHRIGEWMVPGKSFFFASLRLCVTPHSLF